MSTNESLKKRLNLWFLTAIIAGIVITTVFSLIYFYNATNTEALRTMRRSRMVAEVMYAAQMDEVRFFAESLANNRTVLVLADLDIRNKLSEYLTQVVQREPLYAVAVVGADGNTVSHVTMSQSSIALSATTVEPGRTDLGQRALSGETLVATERIVTVDGSNLVAITAVGPLVRDERRIGAVVVRYVLNDSTELVDQLKNTLGTEATVYETGRAVSSTADIGIDQNLFASLMLEERRVEEASRIWFGQQLAQYVTLFDIGDRPVAVLGLSVSADTYLQTFVNALLVLLAIMFVLIVAALVMVRLISRSILNPINQLLSGVSKITEGDLSHEIIVHLRDEIGKLSKAFNDMRLALREKITTIQEMNENLEGTVKQRTQEIESLLDAMKKYLPAQLYDAIVGGTRDTSIKRHFRKKLTVFFSDVVGFTSTTESMEAEDLSDLLNSYLDGMAKIAIKWGGTIDKFVGDAIMVFFGDPDFINDKEHALRAVRMALEMVDKMTELRAQWLDQGIENPLHVRIGINTGYCTIGNFGSENRMDYTIIGGNVNLAQRFESAASANTILISHETYSLVKDEIVCESAGEFSLKGIPKPVRAYRVLGERKEAIETDLIQVSNAGIIFKKNVIDPAALTETERKHLVKALNLASHYANGSIEFVYDEKTASWRPAKTERS